LAVSEGGDENDSTSADVAGMPFGAGGDGENPAGNPAVGGAAGGQGFGQVAAGEMDPDRLAAARQRQAGRGMLGLTGSQMTPVTLGVSTGTEVEVISGLSEGDVVLIPQMETATTSNFEGGPPVPMMGGMFRGGR
jgi:HlyD family secretion protein